MVIYVIVICFCKILASVAGAGFYRVNGEISITRAHELRGEKERRKRRPPLPFASSPRALYKNLPK